MKERPKLTVLAGGKTFELEGDCERAHEKLCSAIVDYTLHLFEYHKGPNDEPSDPADFAALLLSHMIVGVNEVVAATWAITMFKVCQERGLVL